MEMVAAAARNISSMLCEVRKDAIDTGPVPLIGLRSRFTIPRLSGYPQPTEDTQSIPTLIV